MLTKEMFEYAPAYGVRCYNNGKWRDPKLSREFLPNYNFERKKMITINNAWRVKAVKFRHKKEVRESIMKSVKRLKDDEYVMRKTFGIFDEFMLRLENGDDFIIDENMELFGGDIIKTEYDFLTAVIKLISEEEKRGEKRGFDPSVMEDVNTMYFEDSEILIEDYYRY